MAKSDIYAMNCGDFHSLVFYNGLQNTLFPLLTITCNDRTLDFMQLLEEDEDCLEHKKGLKRSGGRNTINDKNNEPHSR